MIDWKRIMAPPPPRKHREKTTRMNINLKIRNYHNITARSLQAYVYK